MHHPDEIRAAGMRSCVLVSRRPHERSDIREVPHIAEPVIGPRFARTRWLMRATSSAVMLRESGASRCCLQVLFDNSNRPVGGLREPPIVDLGRFYIYCNLHNNGESASPPSPFWQVLSQVPHHLNSDRP